MPGGDLMAPAARIAHIKAVALTPGVSKNNRLYTKENIGKAAARMQDRIKAGNLPLTVRSFHAAGDDTKEVCGSITAASQSMMRSLGVKPPPVELPGPLGQLLEQAVVDVGGLEVPRVGLGQVTGEGAEGGNDEAAEDGADQEKDSDG